MPEKIPEIYKKLEANFPEVFRSYENLGNACHEAGPLNGESRRLVKLAMAIASESEGAVHSNVRRALAEGISREKILHVAILALPTIGLPKTQAALSWIYDIMG